MRISKRRREMGEEAWAEYQAARKNTASREWQQRNVDKVVKSRRRKKELLIEYKGGKCERCGLKSEVPGLYDFHHIDPSQKEFGLAKFGKNISFERCKEEVDKCMLVCRNCHATIHHEINEAKRLNRSSKIE